MHPLRVALTLERHQFAPPVIVAGLLHDVVEDCRIALDTIESRFGAEVSELVDLVTEPNKRLPWRERKQAALARLESFSPEGAALKASDSLDNLRSMLEDHARLGEALWARFNAPPEDQLWYYDHVARGVEVLMPGHPLTVDLRGAARDFERVVSDTSRS